MEYSPEFRAKFHPEHLADLAKSGLSEETITALGIYSARPQDIPRLVGFEAPGVTSALVFPYPGEEGFCRIKCFPPYRDKEGKEHKYLQRPGSGVHLYIPPAVRAVLGNPDAPLVFTEGEKKGAALWQAGYYPIGLGGVWNWLEHGLPLAGLDAIAWANRKVQIHFDSNIWYRPLLLNCAYALAREVNGYGATVTLRRIPQSNDRDAGADDYLVAHGKEKYDALETIELSHQALSRLKGWYKDWAAKRPAPPLSPEALAQHLTPKPRLRFAQDLYDGQLFYGIGSGDHAHLLTSAREALPLSQVAGRVTIHPSKTPHPPMSLEAIKGYLRGATEPTAPLLHDLTAFFDRYMALPASHVSTTLALWVLGTYLYQLFRLYPYLLISAPGKRCGKTRLLELVGAVGFASRGLSVGPTEAVIFRGAESQGGLETMDEVQALLTGRGDRERACQALLSAAWQKGATVHRNLKQPDGTQDLEEFHVYRPRALAGLGNFAETLEDRGILLILQRKAPSQPTARLVRRLLDGEAATLRDRCACWAEHDHAC